MFWASSSSPMWMWTRRTRSPATRPPVTSATAPWTAWPQPTRRSGAIFGGKNFRFVIAIFWLNGFMIIPFHLKILWRLWTRRTTGGQWPSWPPGTTSGSPMSAWRSAATRARVASRWSWGTSGAADRAAPPSPAPLSPTTPTPPAPLESPTSRKSASVSLGLGANHLFGQIKTQKFEIYVQKLKSLLTATFEELLFLLKCSWISYSTKQLLCQLFPAAHLFCIILLETRV